MVYPAAFQALAYDQRQKIQVALSLISPQLQSQVLEQWAQRCDRQVMRNPAGYLFGMIDRARNGEFNQFGQTGVGRADWREAGLCFDSQIDFAISGSA
ncbi:hypothetical protein OH713_05730 [Pseudomonas capsici]|nr:hypothetical protein [Pseudomonas capsici]